MTENRVNKKLLFKSSFWYTVSMFLTRGIVFITVPIFTRMMTNEEYGDFTIFASWQAILLIICSLELYGTLNRARFDFPEEKDFDSYIISCLFLSTATTSTIFILYLFFPYLFDKFFLLKKKYMYVMFAYLFFMPAFNTFQTKQRIEYKYKISSVISASIALLSPLLAVLLVLMRKHNDPLYGRIVGQFVLYILFGLIFYIYFICKSKKISFSHIKYALHLGLPLVFSYLGSRIFLSSDMIVIKHMCSAQEVSYLSVTHSASHIILILVETLNAAWAPWFYDMLQLRNNKEIRKVYNYYLWGIVFCTFIALLLGPEIIRVLGGERYSESIFILPLNILCGMFTVLTAQFVNLEIYYKKPMYAAILTVGIAILNIVLDIVGVKIWGYIAVCYATTFCQIVLIALHYFFTQYMNVKEILTAGTLVIALASTLALIPISLLLYQNNLIRYIVLGGIVSIVLCVLAIKREELKQLFLKFRKRKVS